MKSLGRFTLSIALVIYVPLLQAQLKDAVSQLDLTLTPIDVPGAVFTIAWGINSAGDIVGNYGQSTSNDSHGFHVEENKKSHSKRGRRYFAEIL